ncbi:MAG: hypothetical protein KatS3mg012_2127 [Gaiellaceae bacterium]|nr:MAG: hypothetical protein KatS3mg012_2127 [Gaiellaceae bacterium]
MGGHDDGTVSPRTWLYAALVGFVLLWILGPDVLREAIPIWLPFLVALGLELAFLAGALRGPPTRHPNRLPQEIDRERWGYPVDRPSSAESDEGLEPTRERAEPPRRLGGALVGLVVIAALAGLVWATQSRTGWSSLSREARAAAEERLSREASLVAGKPVTIRCDEERAHVGVVQGAEGVARVGGTLAYLTPERCYDLYRLAFRGDIRSSRTALAIAVLAHEAWHLRGVRDEGVTECYALQSGVELGERLGLSEETARQLMRQQLTENALRGLVSAEYRVPPDCRDGGRLDLDPDSARFP